MKKNIGALDGIIRLLIALGLICYGIIVGPMWIALFALPIIVGIYAIWCPIYAIFGISTDQDFVRKS